MGFGAVAGFQPLLHGGTGPGGVFGEGFLALVVGGAGDGGEAETDPQGVPRQEFDFVVQVLPLQRVDVQDGEVFRREGDGVDEGDDGVLGGFAAR